MHHMRYTRNPNVSFRQEQEEIMLFSPRGSDLFVLNETAAFIWRKLEEPQTPAALVDALLAEYEVLPDVAETDVQDCLATMLENTWILSEA